MNKNLNHFANKLKNQIKDVSDKIETKEYYEIAYILSMILLSEIAFDFILFPKITNSLIDKVIQIQKINEENYKDLENLNQKKEKYTRIVLNINPQVFKELNCEQYMKTFAEKKLGEGNLIKGDYVRKSGLWDAFERLQQYAIKSKDEDNEIVIKAILVEMLYILHKSETHSQDQGAIKSDLIKSIMRYIDKHLSGIESLDQIAEEFFISKCHLCRVFKAETGMTVNRYITNRRIIRVRDMCRNGENISLACTKAGFGSYSNFYKIFMRETGESPRKGLKMKN